MSDTLSESAEAQDWTDDIPSVISAGSYCLHGGQGEYEGRLSIGRLGGDFYYLIEKSRCGNENSTGWCGPYRRREDAERFGAVEYARWSATVDDFYDEAKRQRLDRRMICAADPDGPAAVIDRLTAEISALRRRADADPRCWATLRWQSLITRPGQASRQHRIGSFPSPHAALDAIGHHLYDLLGRAADARQVREIRDGIWMITKAPVGDQIPF